MFYVHSYVCTRHHYANLVYFFISREYCPSSVRANDPLSYKGTEMQIQRCVHINEEGDLEVATVAKDRGVRETR